MALQRRLAQYGYVEQAGSTSYQSLQPKEFGFAILLLSALFAIDAATLEALPLGKKRSLGSLRFMVSLCWRSRAGGAYSFEAFTGAPVPVLSTSDKLRIGELFVSELYQSRSKG